MNSIISFFSKFSFLILIMGPAFFSQGSLAQGAAPIRCEKGDHEERTRYENDTVPYGETCNSQIQSRTCIRKRWSQWSGAFAYNSCSIESASSCGATAHGDQESRKCYSSSSGTSCDYVTQTRVCSNGSWAPDFDSCSYLTCSPTTCSNGQTQIDGQCVDRLPLGVNLEGLTNYQRALMFVDAMKTAGPFSRDINNPWWSSRDDVATDANGWPLADFGVVVMIDVPNIGGTYALSFEGQATVASAGSNLRIENYSYDLSTNLSQADVIVGSTATMLALKFTATNNGVKNIKLLRPGYPRDTSEIFHQPFLERVRPFKVLRLMDYLNTNDSPVMEWEDRSKPTDARLNTPMLLIDPATGTYPLDIKGEPITHDCDYWSPKSSCRPSWENRGGAIEYAIALANQAEKDLWINIPVRATENYVRELAKLLKNTLNPGRKVYLEYSNEVWNWQFLQAHINLVEATRDPELSADGETNQIYWAWRRVVKKIVSIGKVFEEVWGTEAMNVTILPVLGGQLSWHYQINHQLRWLNATYGPPKNYIHAIAGAPYFSQGSAENLDVFFSTMSNGLNHYMDIFSYYYTFSQIYGVKNISYEGGLDTGQGDADLDVKIAASDDPRMTDAIFKYLTQWYGCGGDLLMYFNLSSPYSKWGQWGLTDEIDKETVKTAAVDQVLASPVQNFECSTEGAITESGSQGNGTGLFAEFFSDLNFSQPRETRIDPMIFFVWKPFEVENVTPSLDVRNNFSVRWSGKIMPRFSETYTFHFNAKATMSNGASGVRVFINGQPVIDKWISHGLDAPEDSGSIQLEAGQFYDIKVEYYGYFGGYAQLYWSSPSQIKSIVPQSQLYPR